MEIVARRKTVGVENRLVAAGHDLLQHANHHAGGKLRLQHSGMRGGILHQRPRGGDQGGIDAQPSGHRQRVAVPPAGCQHHAHTGRPHAGHRRAGGVGDLMPAVAERAVHIEHQQANRRPSGSSQRVGGHMDRCV